MEKRIFIEKTLDLIDQPVTISGWVQSRRDHGKLVFLDIRDRSGLIQAVAFESAVVEKIKEQSISREDVLTVCGIIRKRAEKLINHDLKTGRIELQISEITILSRANTPPFEINDDSEIDEEVRLKYRYLDLRRPIMWQRLSLRHKVISFLRDYLNKEGFIEIETPMLTKDTPEGAREYLVPSRNKAGFAYALPQSPQQYKQLLMVAGFERYYQIARCMRDEDSRGDRQPEFTQLDLEMSFVEQKDILDLSEKMFSQLVKSITPEKKITSPFPVLTWDQTMEKYHSDKPDLRKNPEDPDELAFAFIIDFPLFELDKAGQITSAHHPFTSWQDKPEYNQIMERVYNDEKVSQDELLSIRANCYDIVINGYELGSGSIRIHNQQQQQAVFKALNLDQKTIEERFGHMLQAFSFGCPPHGGIAPGIDRLLMILTKTKTIREVIAFPKTGDGRDLMMNAPSQLGSEQLKTLHLKTIKE